MPSANAGQDPLLRLAEELRDLGARLVGVADALQLRSTTPAAPPAPVVRQPVAPVAVVAPIAAPSPPAWQPPVETRPMPAPPMPAPPMYIPPMSALSMLQPPPPEPRSDRSASLSWDRWGSRSLAWIGGAVTLLGVVLLLVLAIQRGWLGPLPRLLCGLAFAAALLGVGWRVRRTPSGSIGGFALTATGIAALYLDIVAATALYNYLPIAVGLLAGLVVAVAGLLLAGRWDSPTLAIFVVLAAAACAPIITHGVTVLLVAFLLVLAWAAAPVHLRRRWRWLAVAAYAPPLVAILVLDRLSVGATDSTVTATAVVALITVLACLGFAGVTVLRGEDDSLALGLLIAAPTPIIGAAPLLARPWAVGCLVAVSILLFGIWAVNLLRTSTLPARFAAAAGAAGAVTLFQAIAMATADHTGTFTIAVLGQAILFAAIAYRVRGWGSLIAAAAYATVGLALALAGPLPPALLIQAPLEQLNTVALRSSVAVAALLTAAVVVGAAAVVRLELSMPAIWWPLGFVGLYGFSGTVLCATMLFAPDQQGFLIGQVLVTVGWTACALLLLVKGIHELSARMAGLALVAGALTKLIAFDMSTLDGVDRVAAFLGSGLVVLAAGVRYGRAVTARSNAESQDAPE